MSASQISAVTDSVTGQPPPKRSLLHRDRLIGIGLVTPSIIAIAIFVYGFIGWSIRVSLSNWTGMTPDYSFAGLRQYAELLHDRRFGIDVRNTAIFTVLFLIASLAIGLMLAMPFCSTSTSRAKTCSAAFSCSQWRSRSS